MAALATTFSSASLDEVVVLFHERQVKRIGLLMVINVTGLLILAAWCTSTQSIALQAYVYTVCFDLLSLLTCVLSIWVEKNGPNSVFTFGYERFEVLAIFASTVLAQLGSLFITKESIERMILHQPEIHTGRLVVGAGVAFINHIIVIYGCNNAALDHVIGASSSSWLQEHVSDISQSICSVMPVLSGALLPRINPLLLIACAGAIALFVTDVLIQTQGYYVMDSITAISIAVMMFATMLPMSVYTGKVLLQTTPSHIVGQLDRCLSETLTIDGVLEFRNEHFWTISFGKMAGTLQVRVRRDADEQLVLAHVVDRLSNLVCVLTVQVFKDDWKMRKGVGGMLSSVTLPSPMIRPTLNHFVPVANNIVSSANQKGLSTTVMMSTPTATPYTSSPNMTLPSSDNSRNSYGGAYTGGHSVNVNPAVSVPKTAWNYSVQSTSVPTVTPQNNYSAFSNVPPHQPQVKSNVLFTGTRTFDAESFAYHPR